MKKTLLFLCCLCQLLTIAQTKVAVYVTCTNEIDETIKQIIGSEIVAAIASNPQYLAVERTADFLNAIKQEQSEQISGNIDDQQIQQLGQKYGVQQVCAANIMPYQNKYYIQARMIDVENATVLATGREISALQDIDEIVAASEKLTKKLIATKPEPVEEAAKEPEIVYGKDYSTVGKQNDASCDIINIDNTGENTIVEFKYVNAYESSLSFSNKSYIIDKEGVKYPFVRAEGIETSSSKKPAGITTFTITFAKIPTDVTSIAISEGVQNGWVWEKISLKPYGMANYYLFEDKTPAKYQAAVNKKLQSNTQMQQNADKLGEAIQGLADVFTSFTIVVVNSKSDPYEIEIEGNKIGIAKAKSVTSLRAPVRFYGTLKAKQISGYLLFPTTYKYTVYKQDIGASITIRL